MEYWELLRQELAEMLDEYRYGHCVRTAEMCERLAHRHQVDPDRARLVGLLHDCGKAMTLDALTSEEAPELRRVDEATVRMKSLHHSFTSAYLARTRFRMQDDEMLDAICFHTTGSPEFGDLGIILYLSDYLEPGREFADRESLERMAFEDLRGTCVAVVERRIAHLIERNREVHPRTVAFRDALSTHTND